jgi:hypothetical protein
MDAEQTFRLWREDFQITLANALDRYNGVARGGGTWGSLIELTDETTSAQYQEEIKKNRAFQKGLLGLCRKVGFDPSNSQHRSGSSKGISWEPHVGDLGVESGKLCFHLYSALEAEHEALKKEKNERFGTRNKRRTPGPVALKIILILETFKRNPEGYRLVRSYFAPRGGFGKDLDREFQELRRSVNSKTNPRDWEWRSKNGPFVLKVPPELRRLEGFRGEDGSTRWANAWKNDLARTLVPSRKVAKKVSSALKKSILTRALEKGIPKQQKRKRNIHTK